MDPHFREDQRAHPRGAKHHLDHGAAKRPITIRTCSRTPRESTTASSRSSTPLYEPKGLGLAAGIGWYFADKDEPICTTMERLGTLPFEAQPGERYVYGYNTDVLGCIVEKASGVSLDEYIRSHITGPLGMPDTMFYLPAEKAAGSRWCTAAARTARS